MERTYKEKKAIDTAVKQKFGLYASVSYPTDTDHPNQFTVAIPGGDIKPTEFKQVYIVVTELSRGRTIQIFDLVHQVLVPY